MYFKQVLIHRRIKAKRKQRALLGHRASLQSMGHVALGVIPKSRPGSGYWNPALDNTIELVNNVRKTELFCTIVY